MPVILPVLVVPGVELPELFMPVVALPELFVPVAEPPVLFIPVLFIPVLFIPVPFIPVLALPCCVLPVVLVALFWLPLSVFDEAPIAPVTGSAAKAGAAASNPNAQTEASRRPLSMFNSPMAFAAALGAARQMPAASHSRTTTGVGEWWRAVRITSGCTTGMS
jgi:hypothetical protein